MVLQPGVLQPGVLQPCDSVNAKSHAREKPLLAEYVLTDAGW